MGAPGAHRAGQHPESGRKQREGPREFGVELEFVQGGESDRPAGRSGSRSPRRSPCSARSRWLSSHPRFSATVPMTLSASAPRKPARVTMSAPGVRRGPCKHRRDEGRSEQAAHRALDADRTFGSRRNGPQRRDQECPLAIGLADFRRTGVRGGRRHRGRVGDARKARRTGGANPESTARKAGIPPLAKALRHPRAPPFSCAMPSGLRRVAELRHRGTDEEEAGHEGEARKTEPGRDRGADQDRRKRPRADRSSARAGPESQRSCSPRGRRGPV